MYTHTHTYIYIYIYMYNVHKMETSSESCLTYGIKFVSIDYNSTLKRKIKNKIFATRQ